MWHGKSLRETLMASGRFGVVACAIAFVSLASVRPIFDPDLFWHLRTGDWIRSNLAIPAVDYFSGTFFGRPLQMVDWLADVLLSFAYSAAGFAGIHAFAFVLAAALMLVTVARLWYAKMPLVLLVVGIFLIFAGAAARIYARPQTFGMLIAAVQVLLLERALERVSPWRLLLVTLPALMCLWSNLHGSSPLGLAILGVFAVGDVWSMRRQSARMLFGRMARWGLVMLACVVGLMLASNPVGRIKMGLALTGSEIFAKLITEWQPTEWRVLLGPVGALAVIVLAGMVLNARTVRAWEWLLVVFSAYLASTAWRFVPFFGLLSGPVGLRHLAQVWSRTRVSLVPGWSTIDKVCAGAVLSSAFVLALALDHRTAWLGMAGRPSIGLATNLFPEAGARFLARTRPVGRMFNSFHWGGYLMWSVPELSVFIDGRTGTLYDESFLKENTDLSPASWRGMFAKYQVDWAIIQPSVVEEDMAADPSWRTIYFDDVCAVLVRRGGASDFLADRLGYRYLMPGGLRPGTSRDANPDVIMEARRAVAAAQDSGRARVLLANALLAAGDRVGYEREAAQALRLAPSVASVWYRIGLGHLLDGATSARSELEHAVALAPYSTQYREALALAFLVRHDPRAAEQAIAPVLRGNSAAERLRALADSPLGLVLRGRASP